MRVAYGIAFAGAMLALGGCATVVKGTTQDISVDSSPQGAGCDVSRNGAKLASVTTPGKIQVSRDKAVLTFSCMKPPEYPNPVTLDVEPTFNGATFGNILLGGVVGAVVDASTGANYSYPEYVIIDLTAAKLQVPEVVPPVAEKPEEPKAPPPPTS